MKYLLLILSIIIVFNPIVSYWLSSGALYIDDIFLLIQMSMLVLYRNYLKTIRIYRPLLLLLLFCLASYLLSPQKSTFIGSLAGTLYLIKSPLFFTFGHYIGKKTNLSPKSLNNIIRYLVFIGLIFFTLNLVFLDSWVNITGSEQVIDGKIRLLGPFTNTGRASWFLGIIFVYFLTSKNNKFFSLFPLYYMFLTYIKKTFLGVFFIYFQKILKSKSKTKILLIPFVFIGIVILWDSIFSRFFLEYGISKWNLNNARIALFIGVFNLFSLYPHTIFIGIGPGLYGGIVSGVFYSPVYTLLGYESFWGFNKESPTFVADNYIAHLLGEIGILGTFLLLNVFYKIFKEVIRTRRKGRLGNFFYYAFILFFFETIGIGAPEISQVAYITFFLSGIYVAQTKKWLKT